MKQVIIFQENRMPPIFNPDAPKYDIISNDEAVTCKLTKNKLHKKLNTHSTNRYGNVKYLKMTN